MGGGGAPRLHATTRLRNERSIIACAILSIFVLLIGYPTKAKSHD